MSDFTPELGQYCWSNSPWKKYELDSITEGILLLLGELIEESGHGGNPACNSGSQFDNDTFQIRCYCWCDGTAKGHENGCPPNFVYKGFSCSWYKWCGRGGSMSHELSPQKTTKMLLDCLASLGYTNDRYKNENG